MKHRAARITARRRALEDLIRLRCTLQDAQRQLGAFDWDTDPDLVELMPEAVIDVLHRYVAGGIAAGEVVDWANAIESREDIAYPPLFEAVLSESIFELANPEITRHLTHELALEWCERLRGS